MSLLWRVFLSNAAVLVVATLLLALSPATVSFPVAITEAVVLGVGLAAMLALNFALLRRALSPLDELRSFMREADLLRPGVRAPMSHVAPELRAVTSTFNEMVERLETERRVSAARALAAQENERLRISRELHDEIGQKLTAVLLKLDDLARADGPGDVDHAREGVRVSLDEMRTIARRLRPEALDDLGLTSALTALTNSLRRSGGVTVERRIDVSPPPLDRDVELVIYRVAQEALTNVVRHSNCTEALLQLRDACEAVELAVSDRGDGFDPERAMEGAGIRGMRERALLVGAELELKSAVGAGTTVTLRVPRDAT